MNTQVNTQPQTPKESGDRQTDRQASSQTDLWVSKYIKWKLSFDLAICHVSRDRERGEREKERGRRVETGERGSVQRGRVKGAKQKEDIVKKKGAGQRGRACGGSAAAADKKPV